jgi:hypothetical protein
VAVVLPELVAVGADGLGRQPHVLQHGQVGEDVRDLEGAADAQVRPAMGGAVGDVLALEQHAAAGRPDVAAEQVEEGRFARAVGADDGVQRVGLHLHADPGHGHQPAKRLAQVLRLQNRRIVHDERSHAKTQSPPSSKAFSLSVLCVFA